MNIFRSRGKPSKSITLTLAQSGQSPLAVRLGWEAEDTNRYWFDSANDKLYKETQEGNFMFIKTKKLSEMIGRAVNP